MKVGLSGEVITYARMDCYTPVDLRAFVFDWESDLVKL
jgi:hypothetical protein